jgi:hypothetical protein
MDRVFNGDAALKEISDDDDFLGVKAFASKIAQSILAQKEKSGLVYGLEGSWGSGKSTLANEILNQVTLQYDALNDEAPIIVRFDPWILRGVQPLVGALLEEIKAAIIDAALKSESLLKRSSGGLKWLVAKGSEYREAVRAVSKFGAALAEAALPTPTGGASATGKAIGNALTSAATLIPKRADDATLSVQSLKHHKVRVNETIEKLNRQIIIVIDDIDRLDPPEIMEVLRLVRSVADFSNTTYLLNYDPRIIAHAAEKIHGVTGSRSYLDKIVNIPIRVPVPEAFDLAGWFEREVTQIVNEWTASNQFEQKEHEAEAIHSAVSLAGRLFFQTPRDVRRSIGAVRLALSSITVDIVVAELIWLSIIKIGSGELYSWIERFLTESALTCQGDARLEEFEIQKFNNEFATIAVDLKITPTQLAIFLCYYISAIFPVNLQGDEEDNDFPIIIHKNAFSEENGHQLLKWNHEKSIKSPRWYKYYFSYRSPKHEMDIADENRFFECLDDLPGAICKYIFELEADQQIGLPSKAEKLFRQLKLSGLTDLAPGQKFNFLSALTLMMDDFPRFNQAKSDRSRRGWQVTADLLRIGLTNSPPWVSRQWAKELFATGASTKWLAYCLDTWQESRHSEEIEFKLYFEIAGKAFKDRVN